MPIKDLNELREEIEPIVAEIRKRLTKAEGKSVDFPDIDEVSSELLTKLKDMVIDFFVGEQLSEAYQWLETVRKEVRELVENLRLNGFTYPSEFNSFILNPRVHLRKKLFHYTCKLIDGDLSLDEYLRKSAAALRTSLRTNLRTAYQIWCIAAIMNLLHNELGYELEYPEHRFLNFDRSGKQRLGIIPPNAILISYTKGYLSFFHEAPRPLRWEDTSDLQKVWSLYIALRPDLLVYSGKVTNIVNIPNSPPIKRPNVLIEFKELPDWFTRVRDLKGYLRKPLTAEEWRFKWKVGLAEGLVNEARSLIEAVVKITGLEKAEIKKRVEKGASLRVHEYKLILLYASTYKPDVAILVSKHDLPSDVRNELESRGIMILSNIGFNKERLLPLAEILHSKASFGEVDRVSVPVKVSTLMKLINICIKMGFNPKSFDECLDRVLDEI